MTAGSNVELRGKSSVIPKAIHVDNDPEFHGEALVRGCIETRTNDADEISAAIVSDLGLAHTPRWLFARNRLRYRKFGVARLRPGIAFDQYPAFRRPAVPTKVRVFIDFLEEFFAEEPALALQDLV